MPAVAPPRSAAEWQKPPPTTSYPFLSLSLPPSLLFYPSRSFHVLFFGRPAEEGERERERGGQFASFLPPFALSLPPCLRLKEKRGGTDGGMDHRSRMMRRIKFYACRLRPLFEEGEAILDGTCVCTIHKIIDCVAPFFQTQLSGSANPFSRIGLPRSSDYAASAPPCYFSLPNPTD